MRKIVITRGTNPCLTFRAPVKLTRESIVSSRISQSGKTVIEKSCYTSADGKYIAVELETRETAKLEGNRCAEIQFTYTVDDEIGVSPIVTAEVRA